MLYLVCVNQFILPLGENTIMYKILLFLFLLSQLCAQIVIVRPKNEPHPLLQKRIEIWISNLEKDNLASLSIENLVNLKEMVYDPLKEKFATSSSIQVKSYIIDIMSKMNLEKTVSFFIECASNSQENIKLREKSIDMLAMSPKKEVYELLQKLAFEQNVSAKSAYALCRMEFPEAIPYIQALLKHWDVNIEQRAVNTLLKLGVKISK